MLRGYPIQIGRGLRRGFTMIGALGYAQLLNRSNVQISAPTLLVGTLSRRGRLQAEAPAHPRSAHRPRSEAPEGEPAPRRRVHGDRAIELAKRAKLQWATRSALEKRRFLVLVVSYPRLDGKTVRYDLRKPFQLLSELGTSSDWRTRVDEFRTS